MSEARRLWCSGNEAVARALVAAGVRVVAGYPGGPSGEIVEQVARLLEAGVARPPLRVEWSMNERVALDVAAGAAMAGVRAAAVMKHFGLNVAADVLHSLNVMGVPRLVILVGDDPHGHSSHNEQDSRRYAAFAMVPCLDPGTPEDAALAVEQAFGLSEAIGLPVLVRVVTSVGYAEGLIRLAAAAPSGSPRLWRDHGFHGRPVVGNHVRLYGKETEAIRWIREAGLARLTGAARGPFGVVACGRGRPVVLEALERRGRLRTTPVLDPGTSHPLDEAACLDLLRNVGSVLVVEETDPVVEDALHALAHRHGVATPVHGKRDGWLPVAGEIDGRTVSRALDALADAAGRHVEAAPALETEAVPPVLRAAAVERRSVPAPGHAHRPFFFALEQVVARAHAAGRRVIVMGDVGEAVKNAAPLTFSHGAMGSGIGVAHGAAFADPGAVLVGLCGDATLYSFAFQGVMNLLYNHGDAVLLVADNRHMESSGVGVTPTSGGNLLGPAPAWEPAATLARFGARVWEVDATDQPGSERALEAALLGATRGVRVVVARGDALAVRLAALTGAPALAVDEGRCTGCRLCVDRFRCPAIVWRTDRGKAAIEGAMCVGCGDCRPVCPDHAFVVPGPAA